MIDLTSIGLNMLLCFYYYYAIFVSVPTYMYVVKFMVTDLILIYSPWLPVNPVCIGPYILVLYCVIQYPDFVKILPEFLQYHLLHCSYH